MTLGLKRGTVELRPSSPDYPALFDEEHVRVQHALGPLATDIQHVGSTSVPGLIAKPILDLAVAVRDAGATALCVEPLAGIGYTFMGDRVGNGEAFFAKGGDEARTHYFHLLPISHPHWRAYLVFRDALREDAELRDEYTAHKAGFIERVLQRGRVDGER
ncbi:hypothetical protein DAETH_07330 [Deinococcus aetherius]|uniref:GrpB family protein n=1 Tax=Deinococcus aetherius TaxID=200252 RepID=A0ABN6RDR5_9DEIO|nr:GrpB family protein [Deinococcus aetherius]BDP40764.1 hypothetical protein DAETH_07330 [Deinococcus aetherius]